MMLASRNSWLLRGLLAASLNVTGSGGQRWQSNYYDVLGIPQASTQTDIKAAYYKLSKQYHPDRHHGNDTDVEMAGKKFLQITEAYEVLGNYRLRRLYDKGVIHTAGSQYAQHAQDAPVEPEIEDDAETKFYKSRFRKEKIPDSEGRTPIYDFDEWSRAHYGKTFNRRQTAQGKYIRKEAERKHHTAATQNEIVIFGFVVCLIVGYAIFFIESSYDTPQQRAVRLADNKRKADK